MPEAVLKSNNLGNDEQAVNDSNVIYRNQILSFEKRRKQNFVIHFFNENVLLLNKILSNSNVFCQMLIPLILQILHHPTSNYLDSDIKIEME